MDGWMDGWMAHGLRCTPARRVDCIVVASDCVVVVVCWVASPVGCATLLRCFERTANAFRDSAIAGGPNNVVTD